MENLDLREILKDVPRGTKLYSTTHGDICFDCVDYNDNVYPIKCYEHCHNYIFTKEGKYDSSYNGECILFPSKEQRDWRKFELPCQFRIGDIIYNEHSNFISIYKEDGHRFDVQYYTKEKLSCILTDLNIFVKIDNSNYRLATNSEKELFYNKLQKEGYFWNDKTNSLEKYKFEVGHCITTTGEHKYVITQIKHNKYIVTTDDKYLKDEILCAYQENFNFCQEKFDITTLKPYDKVLTRGCNESTWKPQLFSYLDNDLKEHCYKFVIIGSCSMPQCIPYEGNEHLAGTTNDCDDFYKTW